jgi:methionine salvage enolase-phosphatase E1
MENQREYINKMAVRLKELESEIKELEQIADKAIAETKAEYQQQINELFLKKEAVQSKILKIKETSGNAWEDMKAGEKLSWEVFNDAIKKKSE